MNTEEIYTCSWGRKFRFNDHVVMEMTLGISDDRRTGRLVQVRKGVGQFGSDVFFLRLRNESLVTFENAMIRHVDDRKFEDAFYASNGKESPVIPLQSPFEGDSAEAEYSIKNKWPETGFLIETPKQPESSTQSFAMTVIQGKSSAQRVTTL